MCVCAFGGLTFWSGVLCASTNTTLKTLTLVDNRMGDAGAQALAATLHVNVLLTRSWRCFVMFVFVFLFVLF
jgi:hypothetical protein